MANSRNSSPAQNLQAILDGMQGVSEAELVAQLKANGASKQEHAAAADATSEADRVWFEEHPGIDEYIRPMAADEMMREWVPPGWVVTGGVTLVKQIFPGPRLRRQLHIETEPIGRAQ